MELTHSLSFFIVPITLQKGDNSTIGIDGFRMPADSIWKRASMKVDKYVFFDHVQKFLQMTLSEKDLSTCDLHIYSIDDPTWNNKAFGKRNKYELYHNKKQYSFYFLNEKGSFRSPKLVIYPDASVGLLVFPIVLTSNKIEELMDFNYIFHKIDKQGCLFQRPVPEKFFDEKSEASFISHNQLLSTIFVEYNGNENPYEFKTSLSSVISSLLEGMKWQNGSYHLINPNRCHVFTYIHIPEKDAVINHENLIRLARCQNSKYAPMETEDDVKKLFNNVFLTSDVEGSCLMTRGDLKFFDNYISDSLDKRYIWLYILSVVQKYSLVNMSKEIGSIDDTEDKKVIISLGRLRDLSNRLVRIIVNTYFSDVSDHKQHNDFYHFCCQKIGVERLLHDVEHKMNILNDCLKQKADKRSEDMQWFLASFVASLTIFSGCNDGFEFIKNLLSYSGPDANPIWLIIVYLILFVLIVVILVRVVLHKMKW